MLHLKVMGDVQAIQKFKASKQCENRMYFLFLIRIRVNMKDSSTLPKTHSYLSYCLGFGVFFPPSLLTFSLQPSSPSPPPARLSPPPPCLGDQGQFQTVHFHHTAMRIFFFFFFFKDDNFLRALGLLATSVGWLGPSL